MSLLTARPAHITKSAHTTSIAVGLAALPVALLLAAAYLPGLMHGVVRAVANGGAHVSNVPLDAVLVAMIGVIGIAVGLGIHDYRQEQDKEIFDVR